MYGLVQICQTFGAEQLKWRTDSSKDGNSLPSLTSAFLENLISSERPKGFSIP